MPYGTQLQRLVDSVENHDIRLSRDYTRPLPNNVTLHCFRVVSTKPGKSPPHLLALVTEYEDGGYELYLPTGTNKVTDDVERVCGLRKGEGTLVD